MKTSNKVNMLVKKEKCEEVVAILKALAHPQRLLICCSLVESEKTVRELEKICEVSQPCISQHLSRMRLQGLIKSRKESNFVYYSLSNTQIIVLLQGLEKIFCA